MDSSLAGRAEMVQWTRFRDTEFFRTVKMDGYEYLFILVWSTGVLMLFRWVPAMFCMSTVWVWHFQMGCYRMFTFLWMICCTVDSFSSQVFFWYIPLCTLLVVLASFPCCGQTLAGDDWWPGSRLSVFASRCKEAEVPLGMVLKPRFEHLSARS